MPAEQVKKPTISAAAGPFVTGQFLNQSVATIQPRARPPPPGAMLPIEATAKLPLPDDSPLLAGEDVSRSGDVVIWGDGWAQTQHVQESTMTRRRPEVEKAEHYEEPQVDQMFVGKKMLRLCGGYGHMAVLTNGGDMIYSGNVELPEQQIAMDGGSIRDVAPGYSHTLFLTETGALFSTGKNTYGQLGHTGEGYESIARPVAALSGKTVGTIACGKHHSLCLVEGGDVYAFGCCSDGQCGTGKQDSVMAPRFVKGLQGMEVIGIAAGSNFSMCIIRGGALYSWGDNSLGQLGLGGKGKGGGSPRRLEPALVALDEAVVTVACGWGHAACVTEAGSLYTWGFNLHGQLGLGDTKSRLAPVLVEAMGGEQGGVLNVSCASHMSGALGRDGCVWVWGSAELGRLGCGGSKDVLVPTRSGVEGLEFSQMKISDDRVMAFAPARLAKVEPDCGPITGSTRLVITGNGVFEADRIMVSFSFDLGDGLVDTRVARGVYSAESNGVVCMSPRIDRPATAIVEASFDGGISFTSSSLPFAYYEQPYIRASPDMIAVGVARTLSIMSLSGQGDGGFQGLVTPQCKVLFSTKGDGEVSVEARMGEAGELLCDMPPIGAGHVTVLVAINGQQYGDETGGASVLMYEQAKITGITPDCLNFEKGGTVTVMAENLLSSATIRIDTKEGAPSILSGGGDGEQPASLTLSPSEIDLDAGALTVNLPPTSSPGPLTLSISVDGQDYSGGQPQTLNMFGSLQPALEIPFAAQTGGLVNCLLEDALFPAAEMSVKVGEETVVAARYDGARGGACFEVPPYEEKMSPDMATVPLWFTVDGFTWVPVGSLAYVTPPEVESMSPEEGPPATAVTITGANFPETGQYFVKFEGSGGKSQTVAGEYVGETSVTCESPEMPPGKVKLSLSVYSKNGQFLEVPGDFEVEAAT